MAANERADRSYSGVAHAFISSLCGKVLLARSYLFVVRAGYSLRFSKKKVSKRLIFSIVVACALVSFFESFEWDKKSPCNKTVGYVQRRMGLYIAPHLCCTRHAKARLDTLVCRMGTTHSSL